jgi:galactose mutarotase-like enzyme
VIALENDHLRVVVAPERGGETRFLGRPGGENVLATYGWDAPVPASRSHSYGSDQLDWLSEYRGGWQELFPNAGADCVVDGVPLPFHGETSAARWDVLGQDAASVTLRAAARLPLTIERRMALAPDAATLLIEEVASNESDREVAYAWGHHPAFAALPGMRIDVPAGAVHADDGMDGPLADVAPGAVGAWPSVDGRDGTTIDLRDVPAEVACERLCYLPDLEAGWAALRHPPSGMGVALAWDQATFPHLWLWQETGTWALPWYGRARIVALEPHAIWPADGLAAATARGRALKLAPGAEHRTWITVSLFAASEQAVDGVNRAGRVSERTS